MNAESLIVRVLCAIGRFVLGALIGGFLFLGSWYVWEWNLYLFGFFTIAGGLAAVIFGDRFFEFVKEHWWRI